MICTSQFNIFLEKKVAVGFNVLFSIVFISLHKVTKFILFSNLSPNGIHFVAGKCSRLSNYILIAVKTPSVLLIFLILHQILLHLLVDVHVSYCNQSPNNSGIKMIRIYFYRNGNGMIESNILTQGHK